MKLVRMSEGEIVRGHLKMARWVIQHKLTTHNSIMASERETARRLAKGMTTTTGQQQDHADNAERPRERE